MLISIIIPTYNRLQALTNCIESIATQPYGGMETIVIDDASTDATPGYLHRIQQQYTWLQVITNSRNAGVNYARNRGIERATGKYILFLDSDDRLAHGVLEKIAATLHAHPQIKHFLFQVSDRIGEYTNLDAAKEIRYEDWIRASIGGDFTHVINTGVMKQFLFFEQFRMYEYLNWLRVKKVTAPQLLVPLVVAERERGRADSLTASGKLKDLPTIRSKFEALKLYYSLYYKDLQQFGSNALQKKLLGAVMLGVACNQKKDGHTLITFASQPVIKMLGSFILLLPPAVLRRIIFYWSALK
jgi:glycosyltransferase involved in cell wall biosynthesis